ncbi:MAG: hypothetical protein RI907_3278 [Pseudomonadota bacterium]|jgi:hypothetical protein
MVFRYLNDDPLTAVSKPTGNALGGEAGIHAGLEPAWVCSLRAAHRQQRPSRGRFVASVLVRALTSAMLCLLGWAPPCFAAQPDCKAADAAEPRRKGQGHVSELCVDGAHGQNRVKLVYDPRGGEVVAWWGHQRLRVDHFGKRFDPAWVGSEHKIRFLPMRLQPYRAQGVWLFTTSRRSTGGNGGGFCGSGVEDWLQVLQLSGARAAILARHPIASCLNGIELADAEPFGEFHAFWVQGGQLHMQFLFHGQQPEGQLAAHLDAQDFSVLRFTASRAAP